MNTVNICKECGVYMEARYTVWIPVHKTNDPFEPVCLQCAEEVYGACDEDEA